MKRRSVNFEFLGISRSPTFRSHWIFVAAIAELLAPSPQGQLSTLGVGTVWTWWSTLRLGCLPIGHWYKGCQEIGRDTRLKLLDHACVEMFPCFCIFAETTTVLRKVQRTPPGFTRDLPRARGPTSPGLLSQRLLPRQSTSGAAASAKGKSTSWSKSFNRSSRILLVRSLMSRGMSRACRGRRPRQAWWWQGPLWSRWCSCWAHTSWRKMTNRSSVKSAVFGAVNLYDAHGAAPSMSWNVMGPITFIPKIPGNLSWYFLGLSAGQDAGRTPDSNLAYEWLAVGYHGPDGRPAFGKRAISLVAINLKASMSSCLGCRKQSVPMAKVENRSPNMLISCATASSLSVGSAKALRYHGPVFCPRVRRGSCRWAFNMSLTGKRLPASVCPFSCTCIVRVARSVSGKAPADDEWPKMVWFRHQPWAGPLLRPFAVLGVTNNARLTRAQQRVQYICHTNRPRKSPKIRNL